MSKTCTKCQQTLSLDLFNKLATAKDGYAYQCRLCGNAQAKAFYHKNQEENACKYNERKKLRIKTARQWLLSYLQEHPCPCGEARPECLDFDHIDPAQKTAAISFMIYQNCSLNNLQLEVAKCQVLCANCHRVKTAKDQSWYLNCQSQLIYS